MKNLVLILSLLLAFTSFSGKKPQVKLKYIKMMNDMVRIKVPSSFKTMSEQRFKIYYPKETTPKLVYSSEQENIRISFDSEPLAANDEGLPVVKAGILAGIKKFHPKSKVKDEGMEEVHTNKVGFVEYINKKPEKYYEFVFFTIWNGQVLNCVFRHPKKKHKHWKPIVREMMRSLRIENSKK